MSPQRVLARIKKRPPVHGMLLLSLSACVLFGLASCAEAPTQRAGQLLDQGKLENARALLKGYSGPEVERVIERIALAERKREQCLVVVKQVARDEPGVDWDQVQSQLKALREAETDPVVRNQIDIELSRVSDRLAESTGPRKKLVLERQRQPFVEAERERERSERLARSSDPLLESSFQEMRELSQKHEWAQADQQSARVLRETPAASDRLKELRAEFTDEREHDLLQTLEQASEQERVSGPSGAAAWLMEQRQRFSLAESLTRIDRVRGEMSSRAIELQETLDRTTSARSAKLIKGLQADEIAALAAAREASGELEFAAELWSAAVREAESDAPSNEVWQAHSTGCTLQWELRTHLREAFRLDASLFSEEGVEAIDPTGVQIGGEHQRWGDLPINVLERIVDRASLSKRERLGLTIERLRRGPEAAADQALRELGEAVAAGSLSARKAWPFVAEQRAERTPFDGYRFASDRWLSPLEASDVLVGDQARELSQRLRTVSYLESDSVLQELATLAQSEPAAREELQAALEARFERVSRVIQGRTLRQLEKLAAVRSELDQRRGEALRLIEDEELYFYPYMPPECSADRASLYVTTQRKVSMLVERVRESWSSELAVGLSNTYRSALDELRWLQAVRKRFPASVKRFERPDPLPAWIKYVSSSASELTLDRFAMDVTDAGRLRRDRLVAAYNDLLFRGSSRETSANAPSRNEAHLFQMTNDYRVMLGRHRLAWDPRLQLATRWHSDYIADTAVVGHSQEGSGRRDPVQRMLSAGYADGVTENCFGGSGSPKGALDAWIQSSAHHRNLLLVNVRGMAVSQTSHSWVQNFGNNREFEDELDALEE
ncbi:MAG: hypothetical protein ACI841_000226 [Planctomycetota bacterium]|jgi:hypothetical protein